MWNSIQIGKTPCYLNETKTKKNMLNAHAQAQAARMQKEQPRKKGFFRLLLSRIPRATSKQPPT